MNIGMITGRGTAQAEGDWRLPMFLSGTEEMTEEAVGRLFGARLTLSPQRTTAANHLWVTCDAKTMLSYRLTRAGIQNRVCAAANRSATFDVASEAASG